MFRRMRRLLAATSALVATGLGLGPVNEAEAHEYRSYAVYFHKGSAALSQDAEPVLDAAVNFYQTVFPGERLCIVSHTDTTGSAEDNLARSQSYAASVKNGLIARGIPADKISIRATGEADPPVKTPDETDEPLNRQAMIYHGDYGWREYCREKAPTS